MKNYYADYYYENTSFAIELAEDIVKWLNCGDYDDVDSAIFESVDNKLIYFEDQWEMMKAYQTPEHADYYEARELLISELYGIVKEEDDEEDEENEENEEDEEDVD